MEDLLKQAKCFIFVMKHANTLRDALHYYNSNPDYMKLSYNQQDELARTITDFYDLEL